MYMQRGEEGERVNVMYKVNSVTVFCYKVYVLVTYDYIIIDPSTLYGSENWIPTNRRTFEEDAGFRDEVCARPSRM